MATPPLTDPNDRPDADVVIYDGQCNFCRSQVQRLSWFDRAGSLAYLSLHDARVAEAYADLTYDQMMEQMWIVNDAGLRVGGADAVRYLSRKLPLLWPAMPVLHLPGTAQLWRWLYRQIAKRRYEIAGRKCDEGGTCEVHFGP